MPYTIRKAYKKKCYTVKNTVNKRVMSKCTTMRKAKRQKRLLNALLYNKDFVAIGTSKKNRKSRKKQ